MTEDQGKISRRGLLKSSIVEIGSAAIGAAATYVAIALNPKLIPRSISEQKPLPKPKETETPPVLSANISETQTPPPAPTRIRIPDVLEPAVALKATVTAMNERSLTDSFVEVGGFTKELFEKVRRNTFVVELSIENKTPTGTQLVTEAGTGWIARVDKDVFFLVLNKHAFPKDALLTGIRMGRPTIDQEFIIPEVLGVAFPGTDEPDIAVIKLKGKYKSIIPIETMPWIDNYQFTETQNVLIVGFPQDFKKSDKPLDNYTMGSVVQVHTPNKENEYSLAMGIVNGGNSGSPVILNKDGNPVVAGIVYAKTAFDLNTDSKSTQRQNGVLFHSLVVDQLIDVLK